MKISRNDPCPCGSGLKYKKCCYFKTEEQKYFDAVVKSSQNLKNDARIKRCLHPNQNECSGKIIKAHAIQNNRILKKISENGDVITMDGISNLMFQSSQDKGRKIATTFTGFCSYHDKKLFQEIEDKDFSKSQKQIFLFTYRTMAWHYHKKQEQTNAFNIQFERMRNSGYDMSRSEDLMDYKKGLLLGMKDNIKEKAIFDKALIEENFDIVCSYIWEIPYEISFTVSMMLELEFDINGNKINDLIENEEVKSLYLNIFPANGKSFCVWSWLNINDDVYKGFSQQFSLLSFKDKANYLNNKLPCWTDAVVISPKLWKMWDKEIQEAFISHANFDSLYASFEREDGGHPYQHMDTPWDLFEDMAVKEDING